MGNVLANMQFGKVKPGMVRLSIDGKIAVNVNGEYKTYNPKTGNFVNCNNFVFEIGQDFFFVMPTNKIAQGDIILVGAGDKRKPAYVLNVIDKNKIEVLDYFDGSVKTILPERHAMLGNTYLYSKIVSMFGNGKLNKNTIMKYMMLNTMMGGSTGNIFGGTGEGMNPFMMMMLMGGKNPMDGIFNFGDEATDLFGGLFDEEEDTKEEEKGE